MGRESVGERRRLPRLYAPRDLESEVFPKGIEISGARKGATLFVPVRVHGESFRAMTKYSLVVIARFGTTDARYRSRLMLPVGR